MLKTGMDKEIKRCSPVVWTVTDPCHLHRISNMLSAVLGSRDVVLKVKGCSSMVEHLLSLLGVPNPIPCRRKGK